MLGGTTATPAIWMTIREAKLRMSADAVLIREPESSTPAAKSETRVSEEVMLIVLSE